MKGTALWSHRPYRPFFWEVGDPYLCRVAPSRDQIRLEWLAQDGAEYEIFYRVRGEGDFLLAGKTAEGFFDLKGLSEGTEYEFFVQSGTQKSRVRLARCGDSVGTVVNYLHPDDEAYAYSGRYLCSPSLVRHPDGYLLASMDLYQGRAPQNLTLIFRSDDDGKTWYYVSELTPCFWGMLFLHKGEIYMMATSTEYGDLLIGKTVDGGKTFSAPTVLWKGSNGKSRERATSPGVHKNPQNVVSYHGRIYTALEWGSWQADYGFAPMVASCDENDDLLVAENWHFTQPRKLETFAPQLEAAGVKTDAVVLEGTLAISPEGKLLNHMRCTQYGKSVVFEVNPTDPDAPLELARVIDFPACYAKFMIRYDEKSGYYYTIGDRLYNRDTPNARNLLSLFLSSDLVHWETVCDLLDYRHEDCKDVGFQYVCFWIEGEDIVFLCRTALNGAAGYHDSNYSTFHRISNFRDL